MLSLRVAKDRSPLNLDRVFSEYKLFTTSISPACCSPRCSWHCLTFSPCRINTHPQIQSQPENPCAIAGRSARSRSLRTGRGCRLSGLLTEPNGFATTATRADFKHGGCASPTSLKNPTRRCFDGPVYAPGCHFCSPANSHPAARTI